MPSLILREKVLQIVAELGEFSFNTNIGWIQIFILRHDLTFKKILCGRGESADVNESELKYWRETVLKACVMFSIHIMMFTMLMSLNYPISVIRWGEG